MSLTAIATVVDRDSGASFADPGYTGFKYCRTESLVCKKKIRESSLENEVAHYAHL